MAWRRILIGTGIALALPVAGLAALSALSRRAPALGRVDGRLRPCPASPNCVCSQDAGAAHVDSLQFAGDATAAWERLRRTILAMPGSTIVEDGDGYLHATFETAVFRFIDDAEFLLDPENERIHVRSASRVGHSDLGANRQRVEQIRANFQQAGERAASAP